MFLEKQLIRYFLGLFVEIYDFLYIKLVNSLILGMVIIRKNNRIALKYCEGLVVIEVKSQTDIKSGELIHGNLHAPGKVCLTRAESGEKIDAVIMEKNCSLKTVRMYMN